jgi:hypothetical protein
MSSLYCHITEEGAQVGYVRKLEVKGMCSPERKEITRTWHNFIMINLLFVLLIIIIKGSYGTHSGN